MNFSFTEPVIKGQKYTEMLPGGTALVCEGGGTRGFYTSGVFEAFMDAGIMFPYIIGVSAGAANALSYISGQKLRSRVIVEKYVPRHEYVSKRNLLKHGSMFGYDFIFKEIPGKHLFWDREVFDSADIRFLTGATDCATGEAVWFEKDELGEDFLTVRASCSVPMISKIVKINGIELLDGGTSVPIPIEKSVADGNTFHVIILTRNQGYLRKPFEYKNLAKIFYRKYPKLVETMLNRHEVYNRQVALCERLEREGKAVIIRPRVPLSVDRTTSDIGKLLALYDEGHEEGKQAIGNLSDRFIR
ncbi:MAG: patatin family protein [Clostridiales bacterium]|jgi:predicted patatin/cPLA2 family phospholipase|nr:patatin family protein [Clostridiales bacterium]